MKKLILIYFIFFSFSLFAQEVQKIASEIKGVTVYLNGAQVTREFKSPLQKGKNNLVLVKLPAQLKESSIQVSSITKGIKVLSVNSQLNFLEEEKKSEEIITLQERLNEERAQLNKVTSILQVFLEEESLLKQNKAIGGAQSGVDVDDLKALAAYFQQRLTEIAIKKLELQGQIDKHNQQISLYQSQLAILNNKPSLPQREISILVDAATSITGSFKVDYTVEEAGWMPSYDIRAEQLDEPIKITYKAAVYQNTGEDWKNVKLIFSNADPSVSGQAPFLRPWYLGFNNAYRNTHMIMNDRITGRVLSSDGTPLPGVNVLIKGTSVGTVTDINGSYELPLTANASAIVFSFIGMASQEVSINGRNAIDVNMYDDLIQLSEVVTTGYGGVKRKLEGKTQGLTIEEDYEETITIAATPFVRETTFEFQVDEPYSVKSNGQHEIIDLVEYKIESKFDYFTVPKILPSAFLTAKLLDWESFNFLSGEASLFFEGKFIGKTVLDVQNAADTLTLSLGTDKSVTIERERIKDYSSTAFIGTNKRELKAFSITVKNNKSVPVEIEVEDQVPLSTNDDIKVEVIEKGNAEYDSKTGKLKWKMVLQPGEHKKLEFRYEVKYPKNKLLALE